MSDPVETEVPKTPEESLAELPHGESQWDIIAREFRKERGAVFAAFVIIVIATVSILAPFLANDRPIAYRGINPGGYERARRTAGALMFQLVTPPTDEDGTPLELDRGTYLRNLAGRLKEMESHVAGEDRAVLQEYRQAVIEAAEAEDGETLTELRERLGDYSAAQMGFESRWRFPVLTVLDGIDVGFIVFAGLFLTIPVWRWILRKALGRRSPTANRLLAAIVFGVPILAGAVWWLTVPQYNDLTPYKEGVLAGVDESWLEGAPVIYDAVLWPVIPYGVDENNLLEKLMPPLWWSGGQERHADLPSNEIPNGLPEQLPHLLGTDALGRDLACRMIWGGRISLAVGVVAVGIYVVIGMIIGAIAGYFRGWSDMLISRFIEIVICFPSFFLILTIVAFVGPSIFNIMLVIGLTSWTGVARLVRAEFLKLAEQEFVWAGQALGYSPTRIIFRHILPTAMAPVLVAATFGVSGAILTESGLSFLGLGITIPKPSWGGILADGRDALFSAPWIIVFPGFAIFVTITLYNLVGEAFRDAADPRLRGTR